MSLDIKGNARYCAAGQRDMRAKFVYLWTRLITIRWKIGMESRKQS